MATTRRARRSAQQASAARAGRQVSAYHAAAGRYVAQSGARTRVNTKAGLKGGVVGAAVGTALFPGIGTGVGAIYGLHVGQERNAAKQFAKSAAGKKALARINKAQGKNKSITASHKGQTGHSPSRTSTKPGGAGKANRPGNRGKKSNYLQDSHGRFAGSR